jgi:hypothetical protein
MATTNVLGLNGSRRNPVVQRSIRLEISADDLSAAATSQNIIASASIPAGAIVRQAYIVLEEPFADLPVTSQTITLSIGSGTDNGYFLEGVEVGAAAAPARGLYAADPTDPDGGGTHEYPLPIDAAATVFARVVNQTTNVATLVAGRAACVVVYDIVSEG